MVRRGVGPAHQLPRNASSVSGLSILPAGHSGTPHANTVRQQIHCVIHKSPGRLCLEETLHTGELPTCVGSKQSALTKGDACAGQNEPRSRHVVKEEYLFRGMDAPPAHGSENLGNLWQGSSRPLRLQRRLSLPNLFYKEHGCPGPRMAQPSALCFPPSRFATAGTQASQGTTAQADSNRTNSGFQSYSSCWKLKAAPWPIPLRWGLLSQANGMIWHPRPELWVLHVLPLYGSLSSSQSMS